MNSVSPTSALILTQEQQTTIAGFYEVCIGILEPISAIQYWEQFGYCIDEVGELTADVAHRLYGVNLSLRSIRLYHQAAPNFLSLCPSLTRHYTNAPYPVGLLKAFS